jgi:hypothetical protein
VTKKAGSGTLLCTKSKLLQDLEFDGDYSLGQETGKIELPVYLNSTREDLLFTVDLPVQPVRFFGFINSIAHPESLSIQQNKERKK